MKCPHCGDLMEPGQREEFIKLRDALIVEYRKQGMNYLSIQDALFKDHDIKVSHHTVSLTINRSLMRNDLDLKLKSIGRT